MCKSCEQPPQKDSLNGNRQNIDAIENIDRDVKGDVGEGVQNGGGTDDAAPSIASESQPSSVLTKKPSLLARGALLLIRGYQVMISAYTPRVCRFSPTCSAYTRQAIEKYGFFKGGLLGAWRILRCNPFGKTGFDPVP